MLQVYCQLDTNDKEREMTAAIAWICRYGHGITLREILSCDSRWLRSFSKALGDIVDRENGK